MSSQGTKTSQKNSEAMQMERHEAKYILHPSQIPAIREFIRPFCMPDDNAKGDLPQYLVTTLQLDSPDMALYFAKERESLNRFKLRVRTYGTDGRCPVFMEIKRKIKGIIVKSRVTIPPGRWKGDICLRPEPGLKLRSLKEELNYLNFVRLVQEIEARPVTLIRYTRESYLGRNDLYSRLTFDTNLCYRPTKNWDLLPEGGRWWRMDASTSFGRPFSGAILELKTFSDAPMWMVDMTERFSLQRVGFCKYFTAVRLESMFSGGAYSIASEPVEGFSQ